MMSPIASKLSMLRKLSTSWAAVIALLSFTSPSFAHGDLHDSIDAVSQVIARSPGDASLFLRRAELHRLHKDLTAAEADYAKAGELEPGLDAVGLGLAQLRLAQGRERDALRLLDGFLAKQPRHSEGRALRAEILEKRGVWKKADADLAAAVAFSPEPHYATQRAQFLVRRGQPEAAARCLDEASRRRGRVPVLEQHALEIEERAGLTDAALRRLEFLVGCEPRPDIWLARKARLLGKAGRGAEARVAWQQAGAAFQKIPADRRTSKANLKLGAEIAAGNSTK